MTKSSHQDSHESLLLKIDRKVKSLSISAWEAILGIRLIPRRPQSELDFMSAADRIEEEPINNNYPVTLYTIIVLLAFALLWAGFSRIDQVVSGAGRIISVEQNVILQPQDTAEIKDIRVKVGQTVRKGDILVVLDPTIPRADFLQTEGMYQGVLRAIEISNAEIKTFLARVQASKDVEEMTRQLVERQYQSKRALIESQEKRLEVEQMLLTARARHNDLLAQKNSYEQQLVKARRRNELIELVAPRDGIILELSALTKGSVSKATEPIVTLVPTDVPIIAEISIDPSNISGVMTGSLAKIKLDAFPFQRHGHIDGVVIAVSPDALQSRAQGGKSAYIVRVEFTPNQKTSSLMGKVIPGMTLVAEVISDRRTVLEYIFDPLLKIKMESMNER